MNTTRKHDEGNQGSRNFFLNITVFSVYSTDVPVITVSFPVNVFEDILRIVKRAGYSSPSQFLEVAAQNQLTLEKDSESHGPAAVVEGGRERGARKKHDGFARPRRGTRVVSQPPSPTRMDEGIRARLSLVSIQAAALPETNEPDVPKDHIWGQVNRYLPMKVTARWLAVQAAQEQKWPPFASIFRDLGRDVAHLGSVLETADGEQNRPRDRMLSVGLPKQDNPQSIQRFTSQLIGRLTRSGRFHPAALLDYALGAPVGGVITLSSAGLEFAQLENPIIDKPIQSAEVTLSKQESQFLLKHVVTNVPTESRDFRVVLDAIFSGQDTPGALIKAVRCEMPERWTDLALRTHIFGLLARMTELEVITRVWEGRKVRYLIGNEAAIIRN